MEEFILEDYRGKKYKVKEKFACVLIPTTYVLGKAIEYSNLINDNFSERAVSGGYFSVLILFIKFSKCFILAFSSSFKE